VTKSAPIRILVVDDSSAVVNGICQLLAKVTAVTVVATAGDGRAAVEQVAKHRPDLVVMDVYMPKMNGLEAAREIRCICPGVRIIMTSVHQDAQTKADCLQHGADSFVPNIGMQRQLLCEAEHLFPELAGGRDGANEADVQT
jgi:DNA-binding NarL/FixJ family response regulator